MRLRLLWCCNQSSALESLICLFQHVLQTINRHKTLLWYSGGMDVGCYQRTMYRLTQPSGVKSPLTSPYRGPQNKLQSRYWIGEVILVTPVRLKTGEEEHPTGYGGNMVPRELSMLKADEFISAYYFSRELWIDLLTAAVHSHNLWALQCSLEDLSGILIHQVASAIMWATAEDRSPGLGDIIRDELR